nr:GTPase HflX [Burkholderiales bacterium]
LPHTLVEAFRATLEETTDADLLLHVVDAASPDRAAQMREVDRVLDDIGAGEVPRLIVFNKIDRSGQLPGIEQDDAGSIRALRLSALTGAGVEHLRTALDLLASTRSLVLPNDRLQAA